MKILYVANNSFSSFLQLKRFLKASRDRSYELRVAGYNASLYGITADYTLDSLQDYYGKNKTNSVNRVTVSNYVKEIQTYNPDLIINDFDFYTSFAASELGIPYWIVSSSILYNGFTKADRKQLKFGRHYQHLLPRNAQSQFQEFQLTNADRRFVYSHLGDVSMRPDLQKGFDWVRPYYVKPQPRHHESSFVAAFSHTDKALVGYMSKLDDVSIYSLSEYETFEGITHRNLFDDNYGVDVSNAYMFFSRGQASFLADAFYNEKYCLIYPDINEFETILNSYVCNIVNTGEKIYTRKSLEQISDLVTKELEIRLSIDPSIKFLHEYIEDICF